ncbi:MAG: methyltransferase domain-containing protein [Prevotellaceae bacterium]|jgi:cyclopropane fatty-acyl-phospholipid synthase-like methyltransferase|nr:methyltransferase domain-containing protein [Prevotellaceae bacterium]
MTKNFELDATTGKATKSPEDFFNKVYRMPFTLWGDVRIPDELVELVERNDPTNVLEFGCGLGRFSRYMAKQGLNTTGVDFSSVAIDKAKKRAAKSKSKANFIEGNVTDLKMIKEQFDVSFDIGCFHCLTKSEQEKYVAEVYRLLKFGGTHLIWALDSTPSHLTLNEEYIAKLFSNGFQLKEAKSSRRRLVKSHWYWLIRTEDDLETLLNDIYN